ncbi:MAG: DegV family protein [Lachnospiraceae bacterium]|nr:DegV family protein [Lachnospiraceae bacterium]
MAYKIIGDSCCDFTREEKEKYGIITIPLSLFVDGEEVIDDDDFQQLDFIQKVAKSQQSVKSACPAPEAYMNAYQAEGDIYVVTLSAKLSGSYNSAMVAVDMYEEEFGKKNIHVFDSKSAAAGQYLICKKIMELAEKGLPFEEVVETVETFIAGMKTYFVLESLETLRKNGRLSNVKAMVANVLNIKPVMSAKDGEIIQLGQARGIQKALTKMVEAMKTEGVNLEEKTLILSHCNNLERANKVKEEILQLAKVKEVIIIDTRGVSTLYANDGGIIIAV